jgi:hypothetical protein
MGNAAARAITKPATKRSTEVSDTVGAEVRLGSTSVAPCDRRLPVNFRYPPLATEVVWRRNMSLRAKFGSGRLFDHLVGEQLHGTRYVNA